MIGYVYMIIDIRNPTKYLYVGRTTDPKARWRRHKSCSKTKNYRVYQYIREHGGIERFGYKIMEQWEIPNKDCLMFKSREKYHQILHRPPLNTENCDTGIVAESKEAYDKQYYENNVETISAYKKQYREANIESIRARKAELVVCSCGTEVTRSVLARHKRSEKHINATTD